MENVFDYEDIQLIPAKCIVKSRSECDTSVQFGGRTFKLPVVPANMQTIIDEKLAVSLAENGYFYVMHRFEPETRIDFIKDMKARGLFSSISVGVKDEEYAFIEELTRENLTPEYITIDIAHGHSNAVINMIQHIKKHLPDSFVIAGNVGTPEAERLKLLESLKTPEPTLQKSASVPEKSALQKSKPVLERADGSWLRCAGAQKRQASRSLLTAASAPTETSPNRSDSGRQWS